MHSNNSGITFDVTPLHLAIFSASESVSAVLRLDEVQLLFELFLASNNRLRLECLITDSEFCEEDRILCSEVSDALIDSGYSVKAVREEVDPSFVFVDDELFLIDFPVRVRPPTTNQEASWCSKTLRHVRELEAEQVPLFRDQSFTRRENEDEVEFRDRLLDVERKFVVPAREQLLRSLAEQPEDLHRMSSREFEEFIAYLLDRSGMDVTLTGATRDGGRDILALPRDCPFPLLLLVECKRYGATHKVGVDRVRSLYGVVEAERAGGGLIVTTSRFSGDAILLATRLAPRMNLHDFDALAEWIRSVRNGQ